MILVYVDIFLITSPCLQQRIVDGRGRRVLRVQKRLELMVSRRRRRLMKQSLRKLRTTGENEMNYLLMFNVFNTLPLPARASGVV